MLMKKKDAQLFEVIFSFTLYVFFSKKKSNQKHKTHQILFIDKSFVLDSITNELRKTKYKIIIIIIYIIILSNQGYKLLTLYKLYIIIYYINFI